MRRLLACWALALLAVATYPLTIRGEDARPWARAIKQQVSLRHMPPWNADPHYGDFRNPRVLSDKQIATIVAWVDGGAREGDAADLPRVPQFAEGWKIGTPDLIVTGSGIVPYATYPSNYTFEKDTWIQAIEVRPGN